MRILLAANFGREHNNDMKRARIIAEYERLCNIYHGGHKGLKRNNYVSKTQQDLAEELGMEVAGNPDCDNHSQLP